MAFTCGKYANATMASAHCRCTNPTRASASTKCTNSAMVYTSGGSAKPAMASMSDSYTYVTTVSTSGRCSTPLVASMEKFRSYMKSTWIYNKFGSKDTVFLLVYHSLKCITFTFMAPYLFAFVNCCRALIQNGTFSESDQEHWLRDLYRVRQ